MSSEGKEAADGDIGAVRFEKLPDLGSSSGVAGGIFHGRDLTRTGLARRSASQGDVFEVDADREKGESWSRYGGKKKQVFKGRVLMWLAYQSIGVIYGDIGTSPLYVYSSVFTAPPSKKEMIEVLSLVIWSLSIMVTFKYVLIILRADNEGEGGTFSTYSLLTRYLNISRGDPRDVVTVAMERKNTQDVRPVSRSIRSLVEKSAILRNFFKVLGALGVAMIMADGVLTPAQSVLGAIQGLSVVKPDISTSTIVGTSCGILVVLFLLQPFGTTKLASAFAPIVIIWLGFNGVFGIYNLAKYDHTVLKAFNPYYAIHFFVQRKTEGWKMLGGVLLAFTGVEALFADLGAFSMRAIQISWLGWTYPCLLLAYTGQAANIVVHPENYSNPFFKTVPHGTLYPSLILAILAAIVASQAIITATFQLSTQLMKLSFCPQMTVVHTSRTFHGQVYVPFLNWLLMLGTILVTAVYHNTTRLGHAYGVCVIFVTFFDTIMVTFVAIFVWSLPVWVVFLPVLFFATHDGLYLSSALTKVPRGAWFTLLLAGILATLFLLWRFGKEKQWTAEAKDCFPPSRLLMKKSDSSLALTPRWGGDTLAPVGAFVIFFAKTGVMTPSVFTHFVSKLGTIPEVSVFFHLHPVETPSVPDDERYHISRFSSVPGCYRLTVCHGFMDEVVSPDLSALVYEQLRKFIINQTLPEVDSSEEGASSSKPGYETRTGSELAFLDSAYQRRVLYVVGKGEMKIQRSHNIFHKVLLAVFLWIRDNTRAKAANLRLAMDKVVEVGFVKEI